MILNVKPKGSAVYKFAPEAVEVPALPPEDTTVYLPLQARYVRVKGLPLFGGGEVFMEALGVNPEDSRWIEQVYLPGFQPEPER